ncbi:MAG: DUF192 domain-containing protein [Candidatus Omnitrophota bacterium]
MIIKNITRNTIIAEEVIFARDFKSRLVGLLGRSPLNPFSAMVFPRCNAIHTFFMRFAIDVLFLDGKGAVIGKIENMSPFRITPFFLSAATCLELPAGVIQRSLTQISDIIRIEV